MVVEKCKHEESARTHQAWCTECGSPLGELEVLNLSGSLAVDGSAAVNCLIQLKNIGAGLLYAGISPDQRPGIAPPAELPTYFRLEPAESRIVTLALNPAQFSQNTTTTYVKVWGLDGLRQPDSAPIDSKKDQSVPVPLRWVRRRPLLFPERLLVRPRRTNPELIIHNTGNVEETITLEAVGCEIALDSGTPGEPVVVAAGDRIRATVTAGHGFGEASIIVVQGTNRREVKVLEKRSELPPDPDHPYTAGIDFGTSKSAVFFTGHWTADKTAKPITWRNVRFRDQREVWWLPSAIQYIAVQTSNGDSRLQAKIGWGVSSGLGDPTVVRDMKTHLRLGIPIEREGLPRMDAAEVVADFLTPVWEETVSVVSKDAVTNLGGAIEPEQILAVLAMPVGERPAERIVQEERTRSAAHRAFGQNIRIEMVREPECAAAFFLWNAETWGFIPSDGQLACIFDCGAGTTDVSVVRVSYAGPRPTFDVVCQAGYEFGGNSIDRLIADALLKSALRDGRAQETEPGKYTKDVNGLQRPFTLDTLADAARSAKEKLIFPKDSSSADQSESLLGNFADMAVNWKLVNDVVAPVMDAIIGRVAQMPESIKGLSLPEMLKTNGNLRSSDIRWLCLTGGSVLIPGIVDRLESYFAADLVPRRNLLHDLSQDPDKPLTKNVVQGAAVIMQIKAPDMLGFAIDLKLESGGKVEERKGLDPGTAPGAPTRMLQPFLLQPHEDGVLSVTARLPGETTATTVYVQPLPAAPDTGKRYIPVLRFADTGIVTLTLNPGESPLSVA